MHLKKDMYALNTMTVLLLKFLRDQRSYDMKIIFDAANYKLCSYFVVHLKMTL